jgi:hypothetical protein
MADVMKEWLGSLGMTKGIDHIEEAFSNGYRFGELLWRLNLLKDTEEMKNRDKREWKVKNF